MENLKNYEKMVLHILNEIWNINRQWEKIKQKHYGKARSSMGCTIDR